MSKVNNGNHRRRDEFHFLIEKGMVIHLAGLELSNLKNIYYSIISSFETESFLFKTFPVGTLEHNLFLSTTYALVSKPEKN